MASSESMSQNDSNNYRKMTAKLFVDALLPGTQTGGIGDRVGMNLSAGIGLAQDELINNSKENRLKFY